MGTANQNNLFEKSVAIEMFDIAAETIDIINQNADTIEAMVRGQMAVGKDGDGDLLNASLGPYYTPYTAELKEKYGSGSLGKETDRVTYFMSGYFYSSLFTKAKGNEFITDSRDEVTDKLLSWSPKALELNADNLDYFSKVILIPELQRRFNLKVHGIR